MEEVPRQELTADEMNSPISIIYRLCAYCLVICTTNADFLYEGMSHDGRLLRSRQ